jgi:hypothetical protein
MADPPLFVIAADSIQGVFYDSRDVPALYVIYDLSGNPYHRGDTATAQTSYSLEREVAVLCGLAPLDAERPLEGIKDFGRPFDVAGGTYAYLDKDSADRFEAESLVKGSDMIKLSFRYTGCQGKLLDSLFGYVSLTALNILHRFNYIFWIVVPFGYNFPDLGCVGFLGGAYLRGYLPGNFIFSDIPGANDFFILYNNSLDFLIAKNRADTAATGLFEPDSLTSPIPK